MVKMAKRIMVLAMAIVFLLPLFGDDEFDYGRYSFLTENKWEGKNIYEDEIHTFEFKPFRQKEGSKLYKVRRQSINYYLEEIVNDMVYIPDAPEYLGDKLLQLNRDIYKIEHLIKLPDGREFMTTPTLYRVFNNNYKKDIDPLYGDWYKKSSPDEYHEYRTVRGGDYQFLIFIPDYDWASKYAENGWHYLKYVGNEMFETDDSFPDVRFKLRVESEKEIILIPMFQKHDMSDGIIKLHPVKE